MIANNSLRKLNRHILQQFKIEFADKKRNSMGDKYTIQCDVDILLIPISENGTIQMWIWIYSFRVHATHKNSDIWLWLFWVWEMKSCVCVPQVWEWRTENEI